MWFWFATGLGFALAAAGGLSASAGEVPAPGAVEDVLLVGGTLLLVIGLMGSMRRFVHTAYKERASGTGGPERSRSA